MRVHVINLDRSAERLAEFTRVNAHLSQVTRFAAVDGPRLDLATLARHGLVSDDVLANFTMGSLGCALSHAALWDSAIRSGEALTVCEDDAIFNRYFERCAAEIMASLPVDWDIVVWAWNFDLFTYFELLPGVSGCLAQFDQDRMRTAAGDFQDLALSPRAFRLIWSFGTPCYTVSAKGARQLKSRLLPFRPLTLACPEGIRAPPQMPYYRVLSIDGALNSVYRELSAFVCFPPLAITKNEHAASTIQGSGSA